MKLQNITTKMVIAVMASALSLTAIAAGYSSSDDAREGSLNVDIRAIDPHEDESTQPESKVEKKRNWNYSGKKWSPKYKGAHVTYGGKGGEHKTTTYKYLCRKIQTRKLIEKTYVNGVEVNNSVIKSQKRYRRASRVGRHSHDSRDKIIDYCRGQYPHNHWSNKKYQDLGGWSSWR